MHGTHGEVVAQLLLQEQPRLGHLDAQPRYDTSYQAVRCVARDGRLSYRGQLYQLSLPGTRFRVSLSEVQVRDSLAGAITVRALDGVVLSAAPITDEGMRPQHYEPERGHPKEAELLPQVESPAVEVRGLARYEEVARVAAIPA